jgi:hypothetical protein
VRFWASVPKNFFSRTTFSIMNSHRHKEIFIQEELERRILHGLSCEWDGARGELSPSHQEKFHKPFFSLRDMKRKWGYWSSKKREICLSRNLVFEHCWASVREVLLHELAHQFAEEVLGADDEPPHGPAFERACDLLRANPRASGNCRALDERIPHGSVNPEDKLLIRVKKLMALARSKNQHEAEAAMAKAHELIKKYNVDLLAKDENRDFVSFFLGQPALRHFREDYALSNLLQDFYFVYGIWVPAYVLDKGKMGRVLEISGTIQNLKIACYVHDFVQRFIDFQWNNYKKDKRLNRYRKTDFAVGIIEGFRSKLELQVPNKTKKTLALIELEDPLLEKYVSYKYPRTGKMKLEALRSDKAVLNDGIDIGKELVIYRGIEEKAKYKGLLIGD